MNVKRIRMSPALRQAIAENLRRGHDERELERKRSITLLLLLGGFGLVLVVLLLVLLLAGQR